MSPNLKWKTVKSGILFLLLILEIYIFHQNYPDIRAFVFDTLSELRVVKTLLALAGVMVLIELIPQTRIRLEVDGRTSVFLPLHLAATVIAWWAIEPLWHLTLTGGTATALVCWAGITTAFAGSWLMCLSRPQSLQSFLKAHWLVIVGVTLGMTPLINLAESLWTGRFVYVTFYTSSQVAGLFFDNIVIEPETLSFGVPGFTVQVGHLCSGFEGMGLLFGFLCVYLWLRRDSLQFPLALCILPIGVLASWIANIGRIVSLVSLGALYDPGLAVGAFHSQAGWISFLLLAMSIVVAVERFGLFQQSVGHQSQFPAALYLWPLIAQLLLTLIFSAFSNDFDIFYPVRTLALCILLWWIREKLRAVGALGEPTFQALWLGLVVYILWVWLVPQTTYAPLALPAQLALIWLAFRLWGSVVVVPIVEELAFRGYILRRLQARWFDEVPMGHLSAFSLVISSVLFGLMHSSFLAGTMAGLAYGYATSLRGRLSDAIYAHAVTNLCIAVHVIVGGRWELWL